MNEKKNNLLFVTPTLRDLAAWDTRQQELMFRTGMNRYVNTEYRQHMNSGLQVLTLKKGQRVQEQGKAVRFAVMPLQGTLLVRKADFLERPQLLDIVRKGQIVYLDILLSGRPSATELVAAEDCRLISIPYALYKAVTDTYEDARLIASLWQQEKTAFEAERSLVLKNRSAFIRLFWLIQRWPECFNFNDRLIGDYMGGLRRGAVCRQRPKVQAAYREKLRKDKNVS